MVGRLLTFWEGSFSGAMLNFGGVVVCIVGCCVLPFPSHGYLLAIKKPIAPRKVVFLLVKIRACVFSHKTQEAPRNQSGWSVDKLYFMFSFLVDWDVLKMGCPKV